MQSPIKSLAKSTLLGILLATTPLDSYSIDKNNEPQIETRIIYEPGINYNELRNRYGTSLKQLLEDNKGQLSRIEEDQIREELRRLNLEAKKVHSLNPKFENGWNYQKPTTSPPFALDGGKNPQNLKITFKDPRLFNLESKEVYLKIQVSSSSYSGTKDKIQVYTDKTLIGQVQGAKPDTILRIPLETRRLPKTQELELRLELEGSDIVIFGSKDSRQACELEVSD